MRLEEAMRPNIRQAAEFVRRRGAPADIARLSFALDGAPVTDDVKRDVVAGQRPDGGWAPFWAAEYSSLDATCFRLAQAEQLGIDAADDPTRRAIAFLVGRQQTDGWWEEDATVARLAPPWAAPGAKESRAYLTANCGFWVAALGVLSNEREAARRAAEALAGAITPDGELPGFAHTTWLAGGLFHLTGADDLAGRMEARLERFIRGGLPASSLTWLLSALRIAKVSPSADVARHAASQLITQQRLDGGWPSEDGPDRDVHVTLEAIRSLLWAGDPS